MTHRLQCFFNPSKSTWGLPQWVRTSFFKTTVHIWAKHCRNWWRHTKQNKKSKFKPVTEFKAKQNLRPSSLGHLGQAQKYLVWVRWILAHSQPNPLSLPSITTTFLELPWNHPVHQSTSISQGDIALCINNIAEMNLLLNVANWDGGPTQIKALYHFSETAVLCYTNSMSLFQPTIITRYSRHSAKTVMRSISWFVVIIR